MTKEDRIRILPLGGLGEIGKNMTVYEIGDDLVIVDAGVMFPEDDMPGVDLVIPDMSYLVENANRVKAIILTHGHEDHIGGVPFVLRNLNVPVYGTKLTLGLLRVKLIEHGLERSTVLREISAGDRIKVGSFDVEFIHVNHSIAGVVAVAFHTRLGAIVHCSDFKFDQTPYDGRVADLMPLPVLGRKECWTCSLIQLTPSVLVILRRRGWWVRPSRILSARLQEEFWWPPLPLMSTVSSRSSTPRQGKAGMLVLPAAA